jgi:hypothetical protein
MDPHGLGLEPEELERRIERLRRMTPQDWSAILTFLAFRPADYIEANIPGLIEQWGEDGWRAELLALAGRLGRWRRHAGHGGIKPSS